MPANRMSKVSGRGSPLDGRRLRVSNPSSERTPSASRFAGSGRAAHTLGNAQTRTPRLATLAKSWFIVTPTCWLPNPMEGKKQRNSDDSQNNMA